MTDTPVADLFDTYMRPILTKEGRGRLTNNVNDRGGVTIWGITETMARAAGYAGFMIDMTMDQALTIYRTYFWLQPEFDKLAAISPDLARYMLDVGINCGPMTVGKYLQRGLNVLNDGGRQFADLGVDGHCGAMTRHALTAFRAVRRAQGDTVLLLLMRAFLAVHYVEIAEADTSQETNAYGWLAQRAFG